MMFKVCPYCGANLDPGEHCDCQDQVADREADHMGRDDEQREDEEDESQI